MNPPTSSRIEDWSVGGYALLATACLLLSAGALGIDAPYVGIFVAFWLVGLCAVAAVGLSIIIVAINANRARRGTVPDVVAVAFAVLVPAALGTAIYVVLADHSPAAFLALGLVALVVAPLGLVYRVLGERIRDRWRRRAVESVE